MVSRVELFLIAAILFFATRGLVTEVFRDKQNDTDKQKNLELVSATFYEANRTDLQTVITASRLISYPGKEEFHDFRLQTDELILIADRAIEENRTILLDQNSTIIKSDGTQYRAANTVYDRRERVLRIIGSFVIKNRYGDINGSDMQYDLDGNEVDGHGINAKYEME